MANHISQIRKLLKEDEMKDLKLDLKKEEDEEKKKEDKDDEEKKEKKAEEAKEPELDLDDEEEKVEEAEEDEVPSDEDEMKDEAKEDEEDIPVDEADKEDEELPPPAEDEEEPVDDSDKEFDINDESDVFLDDEEEIEDKEKQEEDKDEDEEEKKEDELKEEDKDDEDEEEKKEKKVEECDKKDKKEEDEMEEAKKPAIDMEEHVKALFNGEELSEEFQKKARTIIESAVREKVLQFAKNLKSRYNKKLGVAKKSIQEKLVTKIDGYMDYIVEEWMEQNKLAVEHGLRTEITEEFITDLRSLFETHNIMIPKGKENLVESLAAKCEKLEKELDNSEKKNVSLKKKINEQKKVEVFREICEGLADTEIEKLRSLASNLEYDDSYKSKLAVLKENYFSQKAKKAGAVEKIVDNKKENEKVVSSEMKQYVDMVKKIRI